MVGRGSSDTQLIPYGLGLCECLVPSQNNQRLPKPGFDPLVHDQTSLMHPRCNEMLLEQPTSTPDERDGPTGSHGHYLQLQELLRRIVRCGAIPT